MAIRKAVLPVAGLGTRFLPVTKSVPKEMLPLVDQPCLERIVAEAVEAGIHDVVFITARGKESMVEYFHRAPTLERFLEAQGKRELLREVRRVSELATVIALRQEEALGLGHAVRTAAPVIGPDEDFAVMLGDDVIDAQTPAIGQLAQAHARTGGCMVALLRVPRDQTGRYGICAGPFPEPGLMHIEQMVEKPPPAESPGEHSIVGRYILPGGILPILAQTQPGRGGEIQLTDALAVLAGRGEAWGLEFEGERFDTGNPLGLLRASIHFALKRPDLAEGMREILREFAPR